MTTKKSTHGITVLFTTLEHTMDENQQYVVRHCYDFTVASENHDVTVGDICDYLKGRVAGMLADEMIEPVSITIPDMAIPFRESMNRVQGIRFYKVRVDAYLS